MFSVTFGNLVMRICCTSRKSRLCPVLGKDCIVVTDMISEAPLSASAPHEICLEKMLVDMYCDKLISSAYSKSEYPEVLKQAMETYHIEPSKMMRYARRRGREDEMKEILEEIENAEA